MIKSTPETNWQKYLETELESISLVVSPLGYTLDNEQPHIGGERYLMTKNKLVLVGKRNSDDVKVVIKISNHPDGKKEIETEKKSRDLLKSLSFANDTITLPKEIYYNTVDGYLIFITLFIVQDKIFVEHSIEEQFFIILRSFEAQEAFHATTFEHTQLIKKAFQVWSAKDYQDSFVTFSANINSQCKNPLLGQSLLKAFDLLKSNANIINKYSNYLVHSDFVPHNFRVRGRSLYMLDCSAVQFGNKYEGWARLLNYMLLHSPEVEKILSKYILDNRGKEEFMDLKLMRIYKIGFLLLYYSLSLKRTSGDLHKLTLVRIDFWHRILDSILNDVEVNIETINKYVTERNALRSEEEKKRQMEFAKAN